MYVHEVTKERDGGGDGEEEIVWERCIELIPKIKRVARYKSYLLEKFSSISENDLVQASILMLFENRKYYKNKTDSYLMAVVKTFIHRFLQDEGWRAVKVPRHAVNNFFGGKSGYVSRAAKEILSCENNVIFLDDKKSKDFNKDLISFEVFELDNDLEKSDESFNRFLNLLSEETRCIVEMKYLQGYTREEIARIKNLKVDKVVNICMKALRLMRAGKMENDGLCRKKIHKMIDGNILDKGRCRACYQIWKRSNRKAVKREENQFASTTQV